MKNKLVSLKKNILATESNRSNKSVSSVGSSFASTNNKLAPFFQPSKLKHQSLDTLERQGSFPRSPQMQNSFIKQEMKNEKFYACTNLNFIPMHQQQQHQRTNQICFSQQHQQLNNLNCMPHQQYNPYFDIYSYGNPEQNIIHYPYLNNQQRQNQNLYFPGSF